MPQVTERSETYVLGHSPDELRRLNAQGSILRPYTEELLCEAGITTGMRVLDAGCGTGDVTLLAAELVGPSGAVVGIDRAHEALSAAQARAETRDLPGVSFREADIATFADLEPFDAVVGRFVLAYQPDPVAVLRHLASLVRPGGIVAFHEFVLLSPTLSWPERPLFQRVVHWYTEPLRRSGFHTEMGIRLHATFIEAGLPTPPIRLEGVTAAGVDQFRLAWQANTVRTMLPVLERTGVATAEEVGIDTLLDRMIEEARTIGGAPCVILLGSGWTRTPAAGT